MALSVLKLLKDSILFGAGRGGGGSQHLAARPQHVFGLVPVVLLTPADPLLL